MLTSTPPLDMLRLASKALKVIESDKRVTDSQSLKVWAARLACDLVKQDKQVIRWQI